MSDKKESVVIIDDHPLFRERLSQLINTEPDMEVCGEWKMLNKQSHLFATHRRIWQ